MQSMYNNWRKFLIEGTFKGAVADTRLLREIDEEELGHIQRALDEMGPEDLAFNELFGGKNRVLIPFPVADTKSELGRFINIVNPPAGKRVAVDDNPWIADFQAGLMTRNKPLSKGEQSREVGALAFGGEQVERKKESMKIGKWLAAVERALKGLVEWHKIWQSDDEKAIDAHEKTWEKKTRPMLLKLLSVSHYVQLEKRFMLNDTDHYADEKILKAIADLRQYWQQNADYIKKNPEGIKKSGAYYIIITRHPIDVLRMSDFDDIYSCHSPPSHHQQSGESFYKCAVAEAHGHGAVAYAVEGDDLEEAYETMPGYPLDDPLELNDIESFHEGEIFSDDKRGEGFIEPVSRLRLRQVRYYEDRPDDDGVQLAIPEEKVYGKRIPGFRETIFDWARENQKEAISGAPTKKGQAFMAGEKLGVDLSRFVKFGGSYEDNKIHVLIPHFLGMVGFGDVIQDKRTEDQLDADLTASTIEQMEAQARNLLNLYGTFGDADGEFKVSYDVIHTILGPPYIKPTLSLHLEWDSDSWKTLPDWQVMRYLPHEYEDFGYSFLDPKETRVNTYRDNGQIGIKLGIESYLLNPERGNYDWGGFHSADEFEEFLDRVADLSRDGKTIEGIRQLTERFLKREGVIDGGVVIKLGYDIQNEEFTSYEWDLRADEGYELDEFELISANTEVAISYKGTTLEVAEKILGSRDYWIKLREQMHIEPQKIAQEDYYVPIDRTALAVEEQDSIIVYRLNYHVADDMPDGQVEVFKELIEFWDDEDEIQAIVQKVFNSFIQEAGTLKQVHRYLDVNRADESKKASGQQLFNNWRRFLNS